MKKRVVLVSITLPLLVHATTIAELFDALKHQPQTKQDTLRVKEYEIGHQSTLAKLYPQIDAFASYDYFSTPTGMVPIPPNSMIPMTKDQTIPQPFSKNISKIGATISMPLFVKSIFTYASMSTMFKDSIKAQKRINLLKNEAIIVGANANLLYFDAMREALLSKKRSLLKTKSFIKIKVKSGRTAKSALFKINDGLSQINIALNDIAIGKTKAIETIETLTDIHLNKPIKMHTLKDLQMEDMGMLEPLKKKVQADRLNLKAKREELYPSLLLKGSYNKSYADAYNNDKSIDEDYGNIGIVLKVPVFDKTQYIEIEKSKLTLQKEHLQLTQQKSSLKAQVNSLKTSMQLLDESTTLYRSSIEDKKRLLRIAKVSFKAQRMSTEDYLKYEDDLASQRAKLYQAQAQKWQTLMQLAVIYTNDIEEMIK